MKNILKTLISLSLLLQPISAMAADMFTVYDIEVSGSGADAKTAKEQAVLSGEKQALDILLQRIVPSYESGSMPEIADSTLSDMVQGIEVDNEKITQSYYKATLGISFNKSYVVNFLEQNGLKYIDSKVAPVVVLPVLVVNQENILWQNDNLWKTAWQKVLKEEGYFSNFQIPNGDETDISLINSTELLNGTSPESDMESRVNSFKQKYKADKILIALAELNGSYSNPLGIKITISYLGSDSDTKSQYFPNNGLSLDDLMKSSLSDIIRTLDESSKQNLVSSSSSKNQVRAFITIDSINDWVNVSKNIKSLNTVNNFIVEGLTSQYAIVLISYKDSYDSFISSLTTNGYSTSENGNSLTIRKQTSDKNWFGGNNF